MNPNIIPFTDEQIASMCSSYNAGASIEALSEEYGISLTAIKFRLRKNGVQIRSRGAPRLKRNEPLLAQIGELRASGMTIAMVCGALGMSPTTYYRRMHA